jgi:hypothetical protein
MGVHLRCWPGCREYVFSHNVSAPATFMYIQETNFVTTGQR